MMSRQTTLQLANLLPLGLVGFALSACPGPTADDEPPVQVFEACEGQDFTITDPVEGFPRAPNANQLVSQSVADGVFAVQSGIQQR
jgi:hypothetical protein